MIRLLEIPKPRHSRYSRLDIRNREGGPRTYTRSRSGACHAGRSTCVRREVVAAAYLRAAHAYMLISMPTGTSTIFGVFQAILALLANGIVNGRTPSCR